MPQTLPQTQRRIPRHGAGADRAVRWSTAAVVIGVGGVAAWISYQHAYDVVAAHGESESTARLVPLTVDGLVYASSMVLLHCARHRLAVPALARLLLALGITATLAANIAHGAGYGTVGAIIAAWPAVALVGSYELLMWMVRTSAPPAPATAAQADMHVDRPADVPPAAAMAASPATAAQLITPLAGGRHRRNGRPDIDVRVTAGRLLADDPDLTGAALARQLGLSDRHGRRLRAELTNGGDHG